MPPSEIGGTIFLVKLANSFKSGTKTSSLLFWLVADPALDIGELGISFLWLLGHRRSASLFGEQEINWLHGTLRRNRIPSCRRD